jgi:hypothetical protein
MGLDGSIPEPIALSGDCSTSFRDNQGRPAFPVDPICVKSTPVSLPKNSLLAGALALAKALGHFDNLFDFHANHLLFGVVFDSPCCARAEWHDSALSYMGSKPYFERRNTVF